MPPNLAPDFAYQDLILQGVSRTFALTIPQLPAPLATVVGNAYLLCRIVDTVEDDDTLDYAQKDRFAHEFNAVVAGEQHGEAWAHALLACLGPGTSAAERNLIANTHRVVRITHGFSPVQQTALLRCVRIMSGGMAEFQRAAGVHGLPDMAAFDRYCYHVAGVVGEMLTELFRDYSPEFARHDPERLRALSVSFGQGLQMTNILKDMWEDYRRGACWLPRSVFAAHGFDLTRLDPARFDPAFARGLEQLVGIAHGHLCNALEYVLYIPPEETGLRRFCLWALGMAVLTLRKIRHRPHFRSGQEVKISRRAVRATMLVSNWATPHDRLLKGLFRALARGLPRPDANEAGEISAVSEREYAHRR